MQVLYDIEIPSQEDEIFEEITLTKGSIWVVFPQSTKYQITAVQKDNLGNIMAQRKFGLNFDLTQATEDLTINLQSNAPKGTTIKAFYSNYFFFELGRGIGTGGGGGVETLTFNSPLEKSNGSVSLDYADDLGLDEQNNLTLKLRNNDDFVKLNEKVQELSGLTLIYVGQIENTRDEVTTTPTLLTDFVIGKLDRDPKNGDLIRTSDGYIFIYSSNNWQDFGKSVIQVATIDSAGVVKLGSANGELEDVGDGKVKVIGWANVPLTNQANTFNGDITITGDNALILQWTSSDQKMKIYNTPRANHMNIEALQGDLNLKGTNNIILQSALNFNNKATTNVPDPTADTAVANKRYVDSKYLIFDSNVEPSSVLTTDGMIGFQRIS